MARTCSKIKKEAPEKTSEKKPEEKRPDHARKVADQVQALLGTPENLNKIQAMDVDPNNYFRNGNRYYRVNVIVDVVNVKGMVLGQKFQPIYPDSFYVVADKDGNILSSSPEIKRKYGLAKSPPIECSGA